MMESGGPSAILAPLERLGQGGARNGKRPSAKERERKERAEDLERSEEEIRLHSEQGESQNKIDIRI